MVATHPVLADPPDLPDLAHVKGHEVSKRALEVAAMRSCACGHLHDWHHACNATPGSSPDPGAP